MHEIIEILLDLCGLTNAPTTFMEFVVWFCSAMFGVAFLSGMIGLIWHTATHTKEIFK